jgi:hypothetical protein
VRAWHWGVTFATAKKLPSLAAGTDAISAPHREGPERAAPNILNNEKVFTVYSGDLVSRSTFLPRIRCVLSAVGMGWLLVRAAGITELLAKS